jgi:hypothetical protein
MPKMTDDELVGLVRNELDSTKYVSTLSREREKSLDYYHGEPFGNEEKGQSQVVSTDVQETVEWIMPSLMRIFTATDKAVVFEPTRPDDEDAARQETDMVNHTFYKENNGFLVMYSFIKDALLMKNGIVKFWWDDSEEKSKETYSGLTDNELLDLLSDENVEPIEHTQEGEFNDVVVMRTNSTGRVVVEPVPPEEFVISADATSVDPREARMCAHRTLKMRSDLIAMGMRKSFVDELPADGFSVPYDQPEKLARDNLHELEEVQNHLSTDWIRYEEAYIRVDFDGDGLAELRQVTLVAGNLAIYKKGKGNIEVDAIPFAATTPIILTHKFYGMSVADTVMDLQLIKSTILRGMLNNTYQINNPRTAVQNDMVNLDDLLDNTAGGIVRTTGLPAQTIMAMPTSPLPAQTFQVMQEMERIRKDRTGVGQDTMGLESNVLANGKAGVVDQSFDMARMRIELIARVMAETGMTQMFLGIHRLLQQNQDKPKWVKIRGEWIEVDPSEWHNRSNMTVNVGLGTGNKDRQISTLGGILEQQKEMGAPPENIHNTLTRLVEAGGYKSVEEFFPDPANNPPPPPKEDPQEQLVKAQIQLTAQQVDVAKSEMETNRQEAIWKHEENMLKITTTDQTNRYKIELEYRRNVPGGLEVV